MSESGCVFCQRIQASEYDGRSGDAVWFEPLNPVTPGHMLFVPRTHIVAADSHPAIAGWTFEAAADWGNRRGFDFNLITSSGSAATQTVRHLHVHYVPRSAGDLLPLPWTPQHAAADLESLTDDIEALRIENAALNQKWAEARAEIARLRAVQ